MTVRSKTAHGPAFLEGSPMATYLVSYDLIGKKDYERLFEHLRTYTTRARPLASLWTIVTEKSATEIRDGINQYVDADDKVLVVKSAGVGAWRGLSAEVTDWLKKHL